MSARRSCAHCGRVAESSSEFCIACLDTGDGACIRCGESLALETLCFLRRNRRVEWADPLVRCVGRLANERTLQWALLRTLAMRLRFAGAVGYVEATDNAEPPSMIGTDVSPYPEFHAENDTMLRVISHSTGLKRLSSTSARQKPRP